VARGGFAEYDDFLDFMRVIKDNDLPALPISMPLNFPGENYIKAIFQSVYLTISRMFNIVEEKHKLEESLLRMTALFDSQAFRTLSKNPVESHNIDLEVGENIEFKFKHPLKKDQRKKNWLYIPIAIAIVVTLFVIFENFNKVFKSPIPVSTKSASHQDIDKKRSVPVVVDAQSGNIEYSIQVGAWKYPNYAQKMLVKLKQYYPEAYISVENNFHKVRIPGIMNKKQDANISKDIEGKFNITPIVVREIK
jgi:hypothetical protein